MSALTFLAANIPVNPVQPPNTGQLLTIINWVAWIALGCCLAGILIAAGSMALQHHRGQGFGDQGMRLGGPLIACVIIGAASGIVGALT